MKSKLFGPATIAALATGWAACPPWRRARSRSASSAPSPARRPRSARTCAARSSSPRSISAARWAASHSRSSMRTTVQARRRQGAFREALLQDKVNFIAGYIWSNVLLASLKTVTDEGDTILISANAGPSQIAGELCNKNFFSTSWNNDQTPMAMGEYLNTKGVKSLYLMAGTTPPARTCSRASSAPTRARSSTRTSPSGPTSSTSRQNSPRSPPPSRTASSSSIPARTACSSSSSGYRPASTRPCRSTRCSRSTRSPCRNRVTSHSARWAPRSG